MKNQGFENNELGEEQIQKIKSRFQQFSQKGCMTVQHFKKSMGLLGVGEAQYLSNRLFSLITKSSYVTFQQFVSFINTINNGSIEEKVMLSFDYLNREGNGFISYDDIQVIISQISFVWNFLTGQKISTTQSIEFVCSQLGISQQKSINFKQYITKYDQYFNWFDFFNGTNKIEEKNEQKMYYTTIRNRNNQFRIDQIEEYLKLVHNQIQYLLYQVRQEGSISENPSNEKQFEESMIHIGPKFSTFKQFQPRGDRVINFRQTLPTFSHQQLSKQIQHQGNNVYQIIASKLQQLSEISNKLFSNKNNIQSSRQNNDFKNRNKQKKRKTILNITKPSKKRRNILYFGHQSWNLMINMMLGIRRSLKSHFYNFNPSFLFTEQDLHCKYQHELIYKRNQKSIKEISQIFVDYAPKVFYYIRKLFNIDNTQFLKSIGLQNLIGNLLMGNLSALNDQTSQGKSGSFMYYTQDSKIIVKSISRDEYEMVRKMLQFYVDYLVSNPDTFLMRIYGLYKMKNRGNNRRIYFMVIGNVFDKQVEIDERYDIKGATHNRQTLNHQQANLINKNVALKDVDLINSKRQFDMQDEQKMRVYNQILKDAQFLKNINIIQYSLLIGIHKYNQNVVDSNKSKEHSIFNKNKKQSQQILSKNKRQSYFFGIIDILSQYSIKKMFENKFVGLIFDINCRDPDAYYERFKKFIKEYIFRD